MAQRANIPAASAAIRPATPDSAAGNLDVLKQIIVLNGGIETARRRGHHGFSAI
ncbi:MAG: hypothetical protein WA729_18565 [Pseudolabrys sp.]|jgi:hypothetical protein